MPLDAAIFANGIKPLPGPNALPSGNFQGPTWNADGSFAGFGVTLSFPSRTISTGGDPPTVSATGPQIDMRGTIDASSANVFGVWMDWATAGSASNNLNGLRVRLKSGYTGGGICRAVSIDNLAAGSASFGGYDQNGNMGLSSACQGLAEFGDNTALYGNASGGRLNVGVFGRSARTDAASDGWVVANLGVMGVASNFGASAGGQIGGAFMLGGPAAATWRAEFSGVFAAVFAAVAGQSTSPGAPYPLFVGRIDGNTRFTITGKAGIDQVLDTSEIGHKLKLHSSQAVDALQILNSSDVVLARVSSAGLVEAKANLTVTNNTTTAICSVTSAGNSFGSGNVRFDLVNGDANKFSFQFAGSGGELFRWQYNTATIATLYKDGSLLVGGNGFAAVRFQVIAPTEQVRIGPDNNNYLSLAVAANGATVFNSVGSAPSHSFTGGFLGVGGGFVPGYLVDVRHAATSDFLANFQQTTTGWGALVRIGAVAGNAAGFVFYGDLAQVGKIQTISTSGLSFHYGSDATQGMTITSSGVSVLDLLPLADDTHYLGLNNDDSPKAWKGAIFKDQGDGKYRRGEFINGTWTGTDLTD